MGQVATVSIGANTYSVYALTANAVADANEYMAARLGASAWTSASSNEKKQSLVSAVRFIDRAVNWSGVQSDIVTPQPLQWPRDGANCDGVSVTDGTVPDNFAAAEFEMALILLNDATVQNDSGTGSNIKRVKAGSAEVEFFTPTIDTSSETRLPTVVNDLVGCYVDTITGIAAASFGTSDDDGESSFDCDDQYGLTRGLP